LDRQEAWLRIYRETVETVYGFVSRRVGGARELAEDVTQETYLRALRHWANGGLPAEPAAWLQTVARNLVADHHRRSRPTPVAPEILDGLAPGAASQSPDAAALLGWALPRLGRRRARLLEAFHLEGRDVRTIAAELGVSERAVEGRLRRARQALEKKLAPYARGGSP
jgi:RNA polymerase sigma-70 factor (ECF subfamily)